MATKQEIGELYWKITGDNKDLDKSLDQSSKKTKGLGGMLKGLGGVAILAGVAALAIGINKVSKELVDAASDAQETNQKFNVVFRGMGEQANAAALELAKGYGLARNESKKLLSNTSDILQGFGVQKKASFDLSLATQKLAADLVSFSNVEGGTERASKALTSAFTGEREALKAYGIVISENELKALAADQGKVYAEMTKAEKATLTLTLATKQSANAIGDFSRSSESYANVQRTIDASLQDIKVTLGEQLLPLFASGGVMMRDTLMGISNALDFFTGKQDLFSNKLKEQKENLIDSNAALQANIEALKRGDLPLSQRKKILAEVNIPLKEMGLKTLSLTSKTEDLNKAQNESNAIFMEKIALLAKQEILQKKIEEATRIQVKIVESEIELGKKIVAEERALAKFRLENSAIASGPEARIAKRKLDSLGAQVRQLKKVIATENENLVVIKEELDAFDEFTKTLLKNTKAKEDNASAGGVTGGETGDVSGTKQTALEKQIEHLENVTRNYSTVMTAAADLHAAIDQLAQNIISNRIADLEMQTTAELEAIEERTNAQLEANGFLEDSEIDRLEAQRDAAILAGDEELTALKNRELDRLNIIKNGEDEKQALEAETAKKKADLEYKASLSAWALQLASATAMAPIAVLNALQSGLAYPFIGPATGAAFAVAAGVASAVQIAGVIAAKPKKPSFAVGTMRVPRDMDARIHKDEIVAPKTMSDAIRSGQAALVSGDAVTGGKSTTIIQLIGQASEVLKEWIFEGTQNRTIKLDPGALIIT
jgi:hypothetical protein